MVVLILSIISSDIQSSTNAHSWERGLDMHAHMHHMVQCIVTMIHLPLFIPDSLFHHTCHPSIHHASFCFTTSLWLTLCLWFNLSISSSFSLTVPPSICLPVSPNWTLTDRPPSSCSSLKQLYVSSFFTLSETLQVFHTFIQKAVEKKKKNSVYTAHDHCGSLLLWYF